MPWKSVVAGAALVLGTANMTTPMAFARGMAGGAHFGGGGFAGHAHFLGGGFAGHRFASRRIFVRPFRRNFATGGFGGFWPYGYYDDYFPPYAYSDTGTTPYPETVGVAPDPLPAVVCHRSEQIVRVPSEAGGSREIKITRCP